MEAKGDAVQPNAVRNHHTDAYATKLVEKVDKAADKKAEVLGGGDEKKKGPAGGFDKTQPPRTAPGYTIKITFHRAANLPSADLSTLSSDSYIVAQINTRLPMRHKQDPRLRFRTTTKHKCTSPEWNEEWIVGNVPADGFELKGRIYDEDPADHDDRLGNIHIHIGGISETWPGITEQSYSIRKRAGSKRAYFFRGCAAMLQRGVHMSGEVVVSIGVLGRTEAESGGRLYTIGPCNWSQHYSPLMGRVAGTKDPERTEGGKKTVERYNFQSNQMQLQGPVPEAMYHRYVEFRPFVSGMFTGMGIRGWILNRALHHQHARIYNFNKSTVYGSFPSPSKDMTMQFLDLVHYDQGGRIFTYVMTLDGQLRFTETGKQYGIDLLSKHTMHSDVNIYIAFSGEFFIRRLKTPWKDPSEQETHPPADFGGGPPKEESPKDPSYYHLWIDNDSGTYRPNKDLLPQLKEFLQKSFPGLKVSTLDCQGDAKKMEQMKGEQRERGKAEAPNAVFAQVGHDDSLSSSDEEDLENRANEVARGKTDKKEPKDKGKVQQALHKISEPVDKLRQNEQNKKEREDMETLEDMTNTNGKPTGRADEKEAAMDGQMSERHGLAA